MLVTSLVVGPSIDGAVFSIRQQSNAINHTKQRTNSKKHVT